MFGLKIIPVLSGSAARVALPAWLADEYCPDMQVLEEILKCVVFIGTPTTAGFSLAGTGFFLSYTDEDFLYQYLVTARHVVWPGRTSLDKEPPDERIWLRMNAKSGTPILEETKTRDWLFADRGIDLCALPIGATLSTEDPTPNNQDTGILVLEGMELTAERAEQAGFGTGDEVFVAGAFIHHIGERRNIPIVRIGNVAAMPSEPIAFASPRKPAYLVETRSLGGISGSPVFLNNSAPAKGTKRPEVRVTEIKHAISGKLLTKRGVMFPYWLVGMVLGTHSGDYAGDLTVSSADDVIPPTDIDLNSGISIVMPIVHIREFLESPPVKKQRDGIVEELRKKSGYRPTSAKRPESAVKVAPEGSSPSHREDFKSLLGAAATKNKSSR